MMPFNPDADLIGRIRSIAQPLAPIPTETLPLLTPLTGIRAVLFDVYGTLLISSSGDIGMASVGDPELSLQSALISIDWPDPIATSRLPLISRLRTAIEDAHRRRRRDGVSFPEVDIRHIWRQVLSELPTVQADRLGDQIIARLAVEYECRVNPVWPMPGLAATLSALSRRGLVLGIVSNAQFMTPLLFEALLGHPLEALGFDPHCCVFSYRLLEAKPSPGLYEEAQRMLADRHGIRPAETLYVGNDIRNDIWPASSVSFKTALFAGDARSLRWRRSDSDCAAVIPNRIVTELRQIPETLIVGAPPSSRSASDTAPTR